MASDLMLLPEQTFTTFRQGHYGRPGAGRHGERCGSCAYYESVQAGNRKQPRCLRMREQWGSMKHPGIRKRDPACEAWEANLQAIVKVQLPVHPPNAPALIYDQKRLHTEYRKLGRREAKRLLSSSSKAYCEAKWQPQKQSWELGQRVRTQDW